MISATTDNTASFKPYMAIARDVLSKAHASPSFGFDTFLPSSEVRTLVSNAVRSIDSMMAFEREYFRGGRGNLFDSLLDVCSSYIATVERELESDEPWNSNVRLSLDFGLLERLAVDVEYHETFRVRNARTLNQHLREFSDKATSREYFIYCFYVAAYFFGRARQEVEAVYESYGHKKGVFEYVKREISLSPEYRQSFISILSYFSEILSSKQPDIEASVSIEQEGSIVRLVIKTEEGGAEIIEQELKSYSLVVRGQVKPEDYLSDPLEALRLQNKLDLAQTEVKNLERILESERTSYHFQLGSLQNQLDRVGRLLEHSHRQNEKLTDVLNTLSEDAGRNSSRALDSLISVIERGVVEEDKVQVLRDLEEIKRDDPTLLERIHDELFKASLASAGGNMLYNWVLAVLDTLPR